MMTLLIVWAILAVIGIAVWGYFTMKNFNEEFNNDISDWSDRL